MTSVTEEIQQLREVYAAFKSATDKETTELLNALFRVQRFGKEWKSQEKRHHFTLLHGVGASADRARKRASEKQDYIPPSKVFEKELEEIDVFLKALHRKYTDTSHSETDKSRPSGIYLVRKVDGKTCVAKFTQEARESCAFSLSSSMEKIGKKFYHWSEWVGFAETPLGDESPEVLESNPSVYGQEGPMLDKLIRGTATLGVDGFREI